MTPIRLALVKHVNYAVADVAHLNRQLLAGHAIVFETIVVTTRRSIRGMAVARSWRL